MGVLKNLVNAKVSGNVGSMNFRKRGSQVVVAERSYSNSSKGKGATEAQREHRCRLANVVNFFKVIKAIEARAWENKADNCSDFNYLSKYNLAASPIFLAKEEAAAGASVIAPYIVSKGTLPALVQSYSGTSFAIGVKTAANFNFSSGTLGNFSAGVINNNADWKQGDKLTIAILTQGTATVNGLSVPKAFVQYCEITLDTTSTKTMSQVEGYLANSLQADSVGNITMIANSNACFAIHSRKLEGQLYTSSQAIILKSTTETQYAKYTGDAQLAAAMDSYGFQDDVLLTPGSVSKASSTDAGSTSGGSTTDGDSTSGGSTTDGGSTSGSGDTTAYYTLNISSSDTSKGVVNTTANKQYAAGTRVSIFATPEYGYTFDKWSDDDSNSSRNIIMNSNVTLVAHFKAQG